jgi:hypothetical protein
MTRNMDCKRREIYYEYVARKGNQGNSQKELWEKKVKKRVNCK